MQSLRICSCLFAGMLNLLTSCVPVPAIQSARVTGRAGISTTYGSQSHNFKVRTVDSMCISTNTITSIDEYGTPLTLKNYFRLGIKDRVEISALAVPNFYPSGILTCGNMKVALFDVGSERLFRNISSAMFAGGDFLPFEHNMYKNVWGGLIVGTHCNVSNGDFELVVMGSGSWFYYESEFRVKMITYKTANVSLGCIYRPLRKSFMEINAGITGRIPFDRYSALNGVDSYSYVMKQEISTFDINPLVLQCGVQIYVPRVKKK